MILYLRSAKWSSNEGDCRGRYRRRRRHVLASHMPDALVPQFGDQGRRSGVNRDSMASQGSDLKELG